MDKSWKISIALSSGFIFLISMSLMFNKKSSCSVEKHKISDCNYKILVPNLVGQEYCNAKEEYSLIKTSEEYSEEFKEGIITNQSPSAGSTNRENGTILVTLSKGSAFAEVPNVIGKNIGDASVCLNNCGFNPRVVFIPSKGESGIVLNYHGISYEKGMKLKKGTEIILDVSE